MRRKNFLVCKNVKYYSDFDKEGFFEWIDKIKAIVEIEKKDKELYLYFKSKRITDQDLRSLIGLFRRFKIDMKQLKIFVNERNKKWLTHGGKTTKGYWYKAIFG